jgi:hypothetical protein
LVVRDGGAEIVGRALGVLLDILRKRAVALVALNGTWYTF